MAYRVAMTRALTLKRILSEHVTRAFRLGKDVWLGCY